MHVRYKTYTTDTYGSECWLLCRNFERRMLRMIYDTINDNGMWRTRYNQELYKFYDELDILQVIKGGD